MANFLVENNFYQGTSEACITDLTPPTFAGITFLDVESRGQIRAGWSAATDPTPPIRYEIYIQASSSVGLFNTTNVVAVSPNLQYDIFTMPDGSFLVNGTTYYVGVRAIDGVNNRDSNTVSMSVISTGVLTSIDTYDVDGAFSLAPEGEFQGTIWGKKNGELATSLNTVLGTASYQVYNKAGTAIVGMSQTGIIADSNGQFKITPVVSQLEEILDHYVIKCSISIDGEVRNDYVSMVQKIPSYKVNGHTAFNMAGNFIASFWAEDESSIQVQDLARLGTASYQVYDEDGNAVVGFSESGISANPQALFVITPKSGISVHDIILYTIKFTVEVDGINRVSMLPVITETIEHQVKATFSINALNQLQATFWAETSTGTVELNNLGNASYAIYDKDGVAVVGLSQTGITPDVNGRYKITPVSAALLTDLTHYSARVAIIIEGVEHSAYKGFTLLGS